MTRVQSPYAVCSVRFGAAGFFLLKEEIGCAVNHHQRPSLPIVLTIAGFDPSCGAGIGADLKTISAHNCYGVAAITAVTVQSTQGVKAVHVTPAETLRAQLDTLAEDLQIAAIKIGMLGNGANAVVVAEFLDRGRFANVVLDPVVQPSAGGPDLLDAAGVEYLRDELMKRVEVITPNLVGSIDAFRAGD